MSETTPSEQLVERKDASKADQMCSSAGPRKRYFYFLWERFADPVKLQEIPKLDHHPTLRKGRILGHEVVERPNCETFLTEKVPYSLTLHIVLTGSVFEVTTDDELPLDDYLERIYNREVILKMSSELISSEGRVGHVAVLRKQ